VKSKIRRIVSSSAAIVLLAAGLLAIDALTARADTVNGI
jgi:hypothetical protein